MIRKFKFRIFAVIFAAFLISLFSNSRAIAEIIHDDADDLSQASTLPIHQWRDDSVSPKAVLIAIHGLTLHGTLFDSYARHLAANGVIVIAPDLRGYGDWFESNERATISYSDSEQDLDKLVVALHKRYKHLPLFCSGESLGGAMTIRLAAANPAWFDGLILSAPAIRLSHHVPMQTLLSSIVALVKPKHRVNLSPYLQQCAPDEQQNNWEACNDTLVRSRLSLAELRLSCSFIDATAGFVGQIPSTMPVLVLQGKEDRVLDPNGLKLLEKNLHSVDQTVQIFEHRGHILLERKDIADETVQAVSCWLDKHCSKASANLVATTGSATVRN